MFYGMRTSIDAAGRLVVPREIRRQAGLAPGVPLEVRWHDGRIEIEPAALAVTIRREGRLVVAVPNVDLDPLSSQTVEDIRGALADERATAS
ncbi:MAG TPA: antitoxin [Chloroflexi bacterium]|jgi:AbrB family looped-hinge helix DNA binding protein|nr:antitoxin [Chloroflexota bacterium]